MSISYPLSLEELNRSSEYVINVKRFGALGTGTDDTSSIQAAVNSVAGTGGTIYFPNGQYGISSTISVSGDYPINLYGEMGSNYEVGLLGSFIFPTQSISGSMFKFQAVGSTIYGLYFKDPTSNLGTSQGSRSITACIEADLFSTGSIILCNCDGIKGSFIKSRRWVRGRILDCHIRDTGDVGKPAIYLAGESDVSPTQAIVIQNPHIEVCYGAPYIYLNQYSPGCKITRGQFECDETIAASNQNFIYTESPGTIISDCGFTVNSETLIYLNSTRNILANSYIQGAPFPNPKLRVAGNYNQITGNLFTGDPRASGISISDSGYNTFSNNTIYFDGVVNLGTRSIFNGGLIHSLQNSSGYAITCNTDSIVSNVIVSNNPGGGIKAASGSSITGTLVLSNSGIGIRCEVATAVIHGNKASNNAAGNFSFTSYPHAYSPNSNFSSDGVYPLQTSVVWDPGSLASGASASQNVTVSGAALGDIALVHFPVIASGSSVSGISLSASAYSANTVKITAANNSGGIIDLDSGTAIVKVLKV